MKTRREWTQYWVKKRWRRIVQMTKAFAAISGKTLEEELAKQLHTPGHYKKFNGRCGCRVCKISTQRYSRAKEKRKPIE